MEKPTLETYKAFLEENKEKYGLVEYGFVNQQVVVFKFKRGCEANLKYLFHVRQKPESITGGRSETFEE
ncbi:hypothetical protein QFB56_14790 [Acinetobacter pittii]|uniref:Uncharacterized protein n=1 Tax=Acinetobacter pittii TaxID=48296 RepID=A0AAE9M7S6_ACIPI|nr:hypothetical protein [Acinetobacter pittii]AZP30413.1 hypothetical protein DLK06_15755 [Acinetobacter pittii]USU93794.1 hypothetical protein MWH18_15795 [Acinetobacter pittii]WGO87999.1 hypothetical protein QFB56_14790 [Acinetobacter pittii]